MIFNQMQPNKCYCALVRLAGYGKSCFILTSRLKQLFVICKFVNSSVQVVYSNREQQLNGLTLTMKRIH